MNMSAFASSQLPADGLFHAADEIGINARFIYQLFVLAMLHNAPVIDDQNHVGLADRREPVRDDEGGRSLHQRARGLLDGRLQLSLARLVSRLLLQCISFHKLWHLAR